MVKAAWFKSYGENERPDKFDPYGFVHLPKEAAWLAEYLHELTAFPKGKHDDQVGSTAQTGASVTSRHSRQRHVW